MCYSMQDAAPLYFGEKPGNTRCCLRAAVGRLGLEEFGAIEDQEVG